MPAAVVQVAALASAATSALIAPVAALAVDGRSGPTVISARVGPRLLRMGPERRSLETAGRIGLVSLACASPFCVVTNTGAQVPLYDDSSWGKPVSALPFANELSGPYAPFGVALDERGRAFYYPAAAAPKAPTEYLGSLRVRPTAVHAGGRVRVFGAIGRTGGQLDCPVGDQVKLLSHAFRPSGREFGGVPTAYGKVARNGSFSAQTTIPIDRHPGVYTVSGRCGGGNLGALAKLRVLPRGRGGRTR